MLDKQDKQGQTQKRYRRWVSDAIPQGEWELIRQAVQRGRLTGSSGFIQHFFKVLDKSKRFIKGLRGGLNFEDKENQGRRKIHMSPF